MAWHLGDAVSRVTQPQSGTDEAGNPIRYFQNETERVWGMWTKWNDTKAGTSFEIGYLKSEKDTWSIEIGPGLQPSGWLGKLANDMSGSQGAPFYLTVDKIEKAKPA